MRLTDDFQKVTAGLNEPLKSAPQVFAAGHQALAINSHFIFVKQLHKLMT